MRLASDLLKPGRGRVWMAYPKEEPRHYGVGSFTCPVTQKDVELEADVPRAWVPWPMRVMCRSCGKEHVLQYDDVRQKEPVFGHE